MATKSPDLNLLPIAFALYDELSVSRAARLLGMSQPAVSMALRRMRETFDDPLFIRVPSGVAPTPRAHAIVRLARPLIERLQTDLLKGETFDPATATRPFTLALSDVGEMAFLPRVVRALRTRDAERRDPFGVGPDRGNWRTSWKRERSISRSAIFRRWPRRTSGSGASPRTASRA